MATKKKKKKKLGRKKIPINWMQFDKLCALQCTLVEIAGWFECSEDTIERRIKERKKLTFAEYHKKASAAGKMSLRRKQFEMANAGNITH
jgi:hypothetical protein